MLESAARDIQVPPELEEAYRGHKVVAFPARGRLSVRDVVSGHNNSSNNNTDAKPRPRSLSAGRTRRTASDLVQDVYNRMGVNYKRGENTLLDDAKSEAAISEPTKNARGRELEQEGSPERRSRSLSRGRLARNWPPSQIVPPSRPIYTSASSTVPAPTGTTTAPASTAPSSSVISKSPRPTIGKMSPRPGQTSNSFGGKASPKRPAELKTSPKAESSFAEEKKEDGPHLTPSSVKDRISIYGGNTKAKKQARAVARAVDPQYAAKFAMRDHPPKIDIYGEEKKDETGDKVETTKEVEVTSDTGASKESTGSVRLKPTINLARDFLASVQAKPAILTPKSVDRPSVLTPKKVGSVLSLLTSPAPLIEIRAEDEVGGNDAGSVGMSSVSGDEFASTHVRSVKEATKKLSWQERNRLATYNSGRSSPKPTPSNDAIEKMVDERVQAHIAGIEARMESQMRMMMQQLEEKVMTRLDAMEKKLGGVDRRGKNY